MGTGFLSALIAAWSGRKGNEKALSIGVWLLKKEMYQGHIRYIKIGRRVVIPRWVLEERLRPEAVKLLPMEMGTGKSTLKTDQETSQA